MPEMDEEQLRRELRPAWLIWVGGLGTLVIIALLCHFIGERGRVSTRGLPVDLLRYIFFGLSAVAYAAAGFIRKRMLRRGLGGPLKASSPIGMARRSPWAARYLTVMIVSLAISDSIAIYGLLLFLLGAGFTTLYMFLSLFAIAMFIYRPSFAEFKALATAWGSDSQESPDPPRIGSDHE